MPQPQRQDWIDLLRGMAVVGMVWVHSANTFLVAAQQAQPWYGELSFYHGLVAPTFFWLAGLMRGMAVRSRAMDRLSSSKPRRPAWPTVRRLLGILGVAYVLHLPQALMQPGASFSEMLRVLCQVDVLHCLAVSCLLLVALEKLPRGTSLAVAMLLLVVLLATPWATATRTGWVVVDAFLNKQQGSLFPLFPWFGFAAAGWLCGRWGRGIVPLGLLGVALAFSMPWLPGGYGHVWFFFERLGWVLLAAAVVKIGYNALSQTIQTRAGLGWLLLAGRESLVMYVAHLLLIYALPLPRQPLQLVLGQTLSLGQVAIVWAVVLLASLAVAWGAEARKNHGAR